MDRGKTLPIGFRVLYFILGCGVAVGSIYVLINSGFVPILFLTLVGISAMGMAIIGKESDTLFGGK